MLFFSGEYRPKYIYDFIFCMFSLQFIFTNSFNINMVQEKISLRRSRTTFSKVKYVVNYGCLPT